MEKIITNETWQTLITFFALVGVLTVVLFLGLVVIFIRWYNREIIIPVDKEQGRYKSRKKKRIVDEDLTIDHFYN